ncbi:MAG: HNH endonuclease [Thermoplasmata archaeon]
MTEAAAEAPAATGIRVLRDSPGWFSVGRRRKAEAHRMGRCAECFTVLARPRAFYCGAACKWKFHGRFFWDSARTVVLRRDRYTCRRCGRRRPRRGLEVDHIVEIARGGAALEYANLQTLCTDCHREKTRSFLTGRRSGGRPGTDRNRRSAGPAPDGEERTEPLEWFPA